MTRLWPLAAATILTVSLAACNGDKDKTAATTPTTPATSGSTTTSAGPTDSTTGTPTTETAAAPSSRPVGKVVYYGGLKVTVVSFALTPKTADDDPKVTLEVSVANEGTDNGSFGSGAVPLSLSSGNHHYDELSGAVIKIPGKSTGDGKVEFQVDDQFSADEAVLTIGSADDAQSVVPLGTSGTLVDNAPAVVSATCSAKAGALGIKVTGGELRSDLPTALQQAPRGKRYLVLKLDVSNSSAGDSFVTGTGSFTLKDPKGEIIEASSDAGFGTLSVANVAPGATKHASVLFAANAPVSGAYTMTVTNSQDQAATPPTGDCALTLP